MRPKPSRTSVEVDVPRGRLFTWLAARWETGDALGSDPEARRTAVMGDGFTVSCPAHPWCVPDGTRLVVRAFTPPDGWRAVSLESTAAFVIRLAETAPARTRLTCLFVTEPAGIVDRGRELLFVRRGRKRALRRLLGSWKMGAERAEALARLRGSQRVTPGTQPLTGSPAPASPPDTGGTDDHT